MSPKLRLMNQTGQDFGHRREFEHPQIRYAEFDRHSVGSTWALPVYLFKGHQPEPTRADSTRKPPKNLRQTPPTVLQNPVGMNRFRAKSSPCVRVVSHGCHRRSENAPYSTRTLPYISPPSPSQSTNPADRLTSLISRDRSGDSVREILDRWVGEGKRVKLVDLRLIIKRLRSKRRFNHALKVSEWSSDWHEFTSSDFAVRLDLVDKVCGVKEAERYFDEIPKASWGVMVYGALLNCYARRRYVEQAEAVLQKLRESVTLNRPLSYNVMLNLYVKLRQFDKMDALMEEMQGKGIDWDVYTYNIRLNAYVAASNVNGMEKLLGKMEADPHIRMSWNPYVVAANGYLNSGQIEEASAMLRRAEHLLSSDVSKRGYEVLVTLYSAMASREGVYRIWGLYKRQQQRNAPSNDGYLAMISSLLKLDDVAGAEKIFEEWELGKRGFDIRIPKALILAYCRRGLVEKAEAYIKRLSQTHDVNELKPLKGVISGGSQCSEPDRSMIETSVDYFEEEGNDNGPELDEELRVST